MLTALIGLTGLLLGVFLNEYFRRRTRVEIYSKEVFDRRLTIYEALYEKMLAAYSIATDIIEKPDYSKEERHAIWSQVVLDVAKFTDDNNLYLNENLIVHCMMTLIGVEDIYYIKDSKRRKQEIEQFRESCGDAKKMIRKESSLEALDRLFGTISKAKHQSDYIAHYQRLKKEMGK